MSLYTLEFLHSDVLNTVIVGPNRQPVYHVQTQSKLTGHVTTIRRLGIGEGTTQDEIVAVLDHHLTSKDTVEFQGQKIPLKEWMPSVKTFSS